MCVDASGEFYNSKSKQLVADVTTCENSCDKISGFRGYSYSPSAQWCLCWYDDNTDLSSYTAQDWNLEESFDGTGPVEGISPYDGLTCYKYHS